MLSLHDAPPLKQPCHDKEHTKQGDKSVTQPGEKSVRAKSHHRANPDDHEDPLQDAVLAQNLLIQEQKELIRRLKRQIRDKRAPSASGPPPKQGQAPTHEWDLKHGFNKRRDRVHREEDSSSGHVHEGPKKQR